jgi:hypothetical protein
MPLAPPPPPLFVCQGGQCVENGRSGVLKAECEKFCIAPSLSPAPEPGPASDWSEDLEKDAIDYLGFAEFGEAGGIVVTT